MAGIHQVGTVMVPVSDQDAGIAFYTEQLGFSLASDVPFGDGERWVEVAPPGGGAAIALVPPRGDYQPGRNTGIALTADDPRAVHGEWQSKGVDVDEQFMGGDGTVPLLFMFRDHEGNHLMVVETRPGG